MQKVLPSFPPQKRFYPENAEAADVVTIGQVRRRTFWPVLLVAFMLLSGLIWQAVNGNIAMAANFPIPFTIQADTFVLTNSTLVLGFSNSGNDVPVAIITDNAVATNLRISKRVSLPFIGDVTFRLSAGNGNVPVRLYGTRTDVQALNASLLLVRDQSTSTNARFGVKIYSGYEKFFNLIIKAPFLSVDSATFPNLHLSVTRP
ncbi:hypothetical protein [Dictyobacter kobayashii]|uniref:Uncharacterized protein n=1 Tax=Dictyobacter kobayashii TaxID=2014872 RepID=A0A402AJ18_9CHLR|nr:hypothetical protein [Dictyobacter kobayashii]GCE19050.1 hypothetical protein KDK_28500 [Dictyobacter kobayashii]